MDSYICDRVTLNAYVSDSESESESKSESMQVDDVDEDEGEVMVDITSTVNSADWLYLEKVYGCVDGVSYNMQTLSSGLGVCSVQKLAELLSLFVDSLTGKLSITHCGGGLDVYMKRLVLFYDPTAAPAGALCDSSLFVAKRTFGWYMWSLQQLSYCVSDSGTDSVDLCWHLLDSSFRLYKGAVLNVQAFSIGPCRPVDKDYNADFFAATDQYEYYKPAHVASILVKKHLAANRIGVSNGYTYRMDAAHKCYIRDVSVGDFLTSLPQPVIEDHRSTLERQLTDGAYGYPVVKPNRYVYAYDNGLFDIEACVFHPRGTAGFIDADFAWMKLDACFPFGGCSFLDRFSWETIDEVYAAFPTPNVDHIFESQYGFMSQASEILACTYVFLGRCMYPLAKFDNWQKHFHIIGLAGTGKSLTLMLMQRLFWRERVLIIQNNCQEKFALHFDVEPFLWVMTEMRRDTKFQLTDFLSMVSHDSMTITRKGEKPIQIDWSAPGLTCSNDVMPWKDVKDSLYRRFVVSHFSQKVSSKNDGLEDACMGELGNFLAKIVLSYRLFVRYLSESGRCVDDILPLFFHRSLKYLFQSDEPVVDWLCNPDEVLFSLNKDAKVKLSHVKTAYLAYCKENNTKCVISLNQLSDLFISLGLKVVTNSGYVMVKGLFVVRGAFGKGYDAACEVVRYLQRDVIYFVEKDDELYKSLEVDYNGLVAQYGNFMNKLFEDLDYYRVNRSELLNKQKHPELVLARHGFYLGHSSVFQKVSILDKDKSLVAKHIDDVLVSTLLLGMSVNHEALWVFRCARLMSLYGL
jgi:hypothetical protein